MMDFKQLIPLQKRRLTSILALTWDAGRLEGAVLRRVNGSLEVRETLSATLSLDPLTADAELVARELRNHLDAAEIRERHCVLGLPLKWLLTAHAEIPELSESDLAGFLQLEAERGFPCDAATLQICTSQCQPGAGKAFALLTGVARTHLAALEKVLHAARLKAVRFGLSIAALQPPPAAGEGVLALMIGETSVGLLVGCAGGIAALRALEGAMEQESGRHSLRPEIVAREARITLGQLPPELRKLIRQVRIFGPRDLAQQLADELELRLDQMGLKTEVAGRYAPSEFGLQLRGDPPVSAAVSLAAEYLAGRKSPFDFLPPRVTAWQQLASRYSSGKLRFVGAVAGSLLLVVLLAFLVQQWQLVHLQSQWNGMSAKVRDLEKVLQQTRQYRPWFDDRFGGLTILKEMTQAFPEDGVVTAKTIEIRDLNGVTCTGTARDNTSLIRTIDKVRGSPGVSEVKLGQIRGKSPMQFTFDFHWNEGGAQ